MIKKIKGYIQYKRNKKLVKRTMVTVSAMLIPTLTEVLLNGGDAIKGVIKMFSGFQKEENTTEDIVTQIANYFVKHYDINEDMIKNVFANLNKLSQSDINSAIYDAYMDSKHKDEEADTTNKNIEITSDDLKAFEETDIEDK